MPLFILLCLCALLFKDQQGSGGKHTQNHQAKPEGQVCVVTGLGNVGVVGVVEHNAIHSFGAVSQGDHRVTCNQLTVSIVGHFHGYIVNRPVEADQS